MKRRLRLLPAGVLLILAMVGPGLGSRPALATPYQYGTLLYQNTSVTGGNTTATAGYCSAGSIGACYGTGGSFNGKTSANHSQTESLSGDNYQNIFGSGTSGNTGNITMGAIHLSSSSKATGSGGAVADSWAEWVDSVSIGGPAGIPLYFGISLGLTGSVSATAGPLTVAGGDQSYANVTSTLSITPDVYGQSPAIENQQFVCVASVPGKNNATCPGDSPTPTTFSSVLTAYSGETLKVQDSLSLDVYSFGMVQAITGCLPSSTNPCVALGQSSADALFLDTALVTLTPLTPGAFYTSASGTIYSGQSGGAGGISATPEPPSALLFLSGCLGVLALGPRRLFPSGGPDLQERR